LLSGWRVRETHRASSAVSYVWDLNASLPVTLQDTAGNRYVYGLDLLTRIDGADEEWYLYDGLGSTTGLADDTGTVTGTYEYDVFGAVRSHTGDATEWSYTGEQHDATGLEYLRARYYDALTGRLLSVDPIPATQRYPYVGQNPTNYTDSSGLCVEPASATVVSGATAVETAGVGPALCWATFAGVATCTVISGCREAVADGAEGIVQGVGSALDAGAEFVGNLTPSARSAEEPERTRDRDLLLSLYLVRIRVRVPARTPANNFHARYRPVSTHSGHTRTADSFLHLAYEGFVGPASWQRLVESQASD
jgi:RHS repeat-associated protein